MKEQCRAPYRIKKKIKNGILSKWGLTGNHLLTKRNGCPNFAKAQNPKALFLVLNNTAPNHSEQKKVLTDKGHAQYPPLH